MNLRRPTSIVLGTATLLGPIAAGATTFNYYTPPKIKARGTATTPIAGAGTVVVKVFVTKAGRPTTFSVVRSTNHGDDTAALEIAKASTYVAATHGTTRQDAFYDYTLKFTSTGVATDPNAATGLGKYKLMISAGNYSGAQAGLKTYLAANPSDTAAQLQLGIADQYLNDPVAAAAAFDKAGTIPTNYNAAVVHAYNDAASEAYKTKSYADSVAYAKKAVAISPGPFTYNTLGTSEDAAGSSDAAIADLENARKLAAADAAFKASDRATLDGNLVSAYMNAGKVDQAKVVAAEALKLDPTSTKAQSFIAQYYVRQASDAQAKQNYPVAAGFFEQAAASAPTSEQPNLYAQAALTYLKVKDNPPSDKAKADADKALAIAPDNALANFAAGIALANQSGKSKDALVYLNKADASAKSANDTSLVAAIENIIKQVSGTK